MHRVTPSPQSTRNERSYKENRSSPPDEHTERASALWVFMREMARCEIDGRPPPKVPKEALRLRRNVAKRGSELDSQPQGLQWT